MDYLGQPLKRFEDARLLTGNGLFIDDIKLQDMLYAVVVRIIHTHARIRSIDTSGSFLADWRLAKIKTIWRQIWYLSADNWRSG